MVQYIEMKFVGHTPRVTAKYFRHLGAN